jgi:hypothetical protein
VTWTPIERLVPEPLERDLRDRATSLGTVPRLAHDVGRRPW